jgi:epoxyqueuosine reductase
MQRLSPIKSAFIHEAHRLGFSHVGIARAHPVPQYQAYLDWISAGRHADMHYLARPDTLAKRADPELILAGCQRVICLAIPYNPPITPQNTTTFGYGRISAYARTRDYHLVIADKLNHLEDCLHTLAGETVKVKSYVDTGPVLERAFAVQAGLGMPGKNTNLIIPGTGSYIFLAVMLTDLALPIDVPFTRDLCGSCQRCIEACPTSCIQPDRTIDARRCISYLTIENKGPIPPGLRKQVGSWLFGCDICQMVCPHNAHPQNPAGPLNQPHLPELIDLKEILTWDEDGFRSGTGNTALSRPKLRGLLRNAAVILGNQGEIDALQGLKDRLEKETDPVVRDALQWAMDRIEQTITDEQTKDD